ncbi:hypothetical protein AY599_21650 [Leptolyngbya valderiana BDU 20041]|nr:hypothetical protein AY599_21650 [Leptolyngbya valderiana BDU 20041]
MPRVTGFESTPNPNAVKVLVEGALADAPRSYREPPGDDCTDVLARALYAIEGVRVVLIHHDFVTVGKAPDAKWSTIKRKAKAAIEAFDPAGPDADG